MIINKKRAVAYFDILGFKAKIINTPLDKLSAKYDRIIQQTDGEFTLEDSQFIRREVCYRYVFSDSIFLVAKEDTEESFIDMLSYAWRMMQFFLVSGFALRGAVTYGYIYANIDYNVFVGKAIVDAVVLEGQQDWCGAVVDKPVIERYYHIFEREDIQGAIMRCLLPIHDVAFKNGERKDYHVINWRMNLASEIGIKALFKNEDHDESAQRKIDNALRFSKEVFESGLYKFNDEVIPIRYRVLIVGEKTPPDPKKPFFPLNDGY